MLLSQETRKGIITGEERKAGNAKSNKTHALKKKKGGLTRRKKNQMEIKKAFMGVEGEQ